MGHWVTKNKAPHSGFCLHKPGLPLALNRQPMLITLTPRIDSLTHFNQRFSFLSIKSKKNSEPFIGSPYYFSNMRYLLETGQP